MAVKALISKVTLPESSALERVRLIVCILKCLVTVSYTHLDVYKRQVSPILIIFCNTIQKL